MWNWGMHKRNTDLSYHKSISVAWVYPSELNIYGLITEDGCKVVIAGDPQRTHKCHSWSVSTDCERRIWLPWERRQYSLNWRKQIHLLLGHKWALYFVFGLQSHQLICHMHFLTTSPMILCLVIAFLIEWIWRISWCDGRVNWSSVFQTQSAMLILSV